MFPIWIIEINYYIAFIIGFIGNTAVIFISMNVRSKEIRAYRWVISIQAAVEASVCIMNFLVKYVCFNLLSTIIYLITEAHLYSKSGKELDIGGVLQHDIWRPRFSAAAVKMVLEGRKL